MQQKSKQNTSTIWGGRFDKRNHPLMQKLNASIAVDKRLATQDVLASKAHVTMLAQTKIITSTQADTLIAGLERVQQDIDADTLPLTEDLEDIHMNIENRLQQHIGDDALMLHTARSRNDQVATDFRLWMRTANTTIDGYLADMQRTLCTLAENNLETLMPGMTHLQPAQVITLAHHLLAYVFMFGRDRSRLQDASKRLNECPLGACALAGTSFPIDRNMTAEALGFIQPMPNAMDAVSDRDFALDFLTNAAIAATHMSRLCEDLILWSSPAFAFITIDDSWTTGSSIMPQKRNPDAAEIIRSFNGSIIGAMVSLFITLKALPLAYSKDMQQDKAPTFQAYDLWQESLVAMTLMLDTMTIHKDAMVKAAQQGYTNATDLADWLVQKKNMPFRKAHHIVGRIVAVAEKQGIPLEAMPLAEMQRLCPLIEADACAVLSPAHAVASRKSFGGTAPAQARLAITQARKTFRL